MKCKGLIPLRFAKASRLVVISLGIMVGAGHGQDIGAGTAGDHQIRDRMGERLRQVDEIIAKVDTSYAKARSNAVRRTLIAARLLRGHGCRALLLQFTIAQRFFAILFPLAAAHLILEGRCFDYNAKRARTLIEARLGRSQYDHEALALMGLLYFRGLGVDMDKVRAGVYFKRAALSAGGLILGKGDRTDFRSEKDLAEFWNVSVEDYWLLSMNGATGPWYLPAPLKADIEWIRAVRHDGSAAIMKVAFDLREGANGLPQDPVLALRWLESTVYDGYVPAFYPTAMWIRDRNFTGARQRAQGDLAYRRFELSLANDLLIRAARSDDRRASPVIYRLLRQTADYDRRDWAMYYWLKRMRRDGHGVDDAALEAAAGALDPADRAMVDGWGVHELPPFTRLNRALPPDH